MYGIYFGKTYYGNSYWGMSYVVTTAIANLFTVLDVSRLGISI